MRYIRTLFLFACSVFALCQPVIAAKVKVDKVGTILKDAETVMKNVTVKEAVNQHNAILQRILNAAVREDVKNSQRTELYYVAAQIDESLNGIDNRKAYLKQAYDTAHFFNMLLAMYEHLDLCDSVDRVPNAKGVSNPRYHQRTATKRAKHRSNIFNGAKYFLSKKDYKRAFSFLDIYYKFRTHDKDENIDKTVLWATQCCYLTKNHEGTLSYVDKAIPLSDSTVRPVLQEYKVETYKSMGIDTLWLIALQEGAQAYPWHYYFFVHLADYYGLIKNVSAGYSLCDYQLSFYPDDAMFWFAKSKFAHIEKDYKKCIAYADSALLHDSLYTDAHYIRAVSYLELANNIEANKSTDVKDPKFKQDRQALKEMYKNALPSLELVR
ncbi:MAG: hypothetical protein HUK03_04225, partial [Bacteroidaceae bacterium]|nr:hypothetical protein [Bacteroidaceae bacterium]